MSRRRNKSKPDRHPKRVPKTQPGVPEGSPDGPGQKGTRWGILVFFLCLACYLAVFYLEPLPSFQDISRGMIFQLWLIPEDLVGGWFGDGSLQRGLVDRATIALVSICILVFAWVVGQLLLGWLGAGRELTRLESVVFAMGLGLNAVSMLTLIVGLAGWMTPTAIVVPAGCLLLVACWNALRQRGSGGVQPEEIAEGQPSKSDWLGPGALCLGIPFVAVILLGSVLPPVDFDVCEYHCQAPKEWYQQGRISFLPHNVYANMPLGAEMHVLASMILMPGHDNWWWGALAGKVVIGAFAVLTALGLFAAGRRYVGTTAGVVAAVVYVSIPWVAKVSIAGLVEGAMAFYFFSSFYAILLWRDTGPGTSSADHPDDRSAPVSNHLGGHIGLLLVAGLLAGAAASCKYTALVLVALPLAAWVLWSGRGGRLQWKAALIFSTSVMVGCGIWYGKNWVLAGNPFYPLLGDWIPGAQPDGWRRWQQAHAIPPYTFWNAIDAARRILWRSEWLSPLVVPLAALSFCIPRHRRLVFIVAGLFGYMIVAWWLFTHRIERFWVPALPLAALLAGIGATWDSAASKFWRRSLVVILVWGLLSNATIMTSPVMRLDNRYFVALEDLRDDKWTVSTVHRYLNSDDFKGQTVLLVGDATPFDLRVPVLYSTCFDECHLERLLEGRSKQQRLDALRRHEISHIYVHWPEIWRYRGTYGYSDFVQQEVLDQLVEDGILELDTGLELFLGAEDRTEEYREHLKSSLGQLYRVVPGP